MSSRCTLWFRTVPDAIGVSSRPTPVRAEAVASDPAREPRRPSAEPTRAADASRPNVLSV